MEKPTEQQAYAIAEVKLFNPIAKLPRVADEVVSAGSVYSTYDLSDENTRGEVYDIMVKGGQPADAFIGREFNIRHVTIFPVTFTDDKTGEEKSLPLILITTEDGDVIQFVSKGIWGSLLMAQACGFSPFGPNKQQFKIAQVPLKDGKRFYQLHRADKPKKK